MTVTQSVRDEILRHPGPTLIESGVDTAGPVASPVVRARVPTTGALDRRTSMNGVALAAGDAAALWLLLGLTLTPALGGQDLEIYLRNQPDSRVARELGRQLAGAPMRRAVGRRPPCGLQAAGFQQGWSRCS